jgi:hypothetical protein
LEAWLGLDLADHGYRFWLTPQERAQPLQRVAAALLVEGGGGPASPHRGGNQRTLSPPGQRDAKSP